MAALRAIGIVVLAALAGAGAGLLASVGDGLIGAVAASAGLVLAVAVLLRQALRVRQADRVTAEPPPEVAPPERTSIARLCFYAGCLTITFSEWRPAGITVSEIFFLLAFGGAIFEVLRGRPLAPVPLLVVLGGTVFAVGGVLSSQDAVHPAESLVETAQGVYVMVLWGWTAAMLLRRRSHFTAAVSLWAVSAAVSGLVAIGQSFGAPGLPTSYYGHRMVAFTFHPNDLGGGAAIVLVPTLAIVAQAFVRRGLASGLRWSAVAALVIAGLALSGSVAGMLGGLLALIFWLVSPTVRSPMRVAIVGLIAIAVAGGSIAGGALSPIERVRQVTSSSTEVKGGGSGEARVGSTKEAWSGIVESPWVGVGLDTESASVRTLEAGGLPGAGLVHNLPIAAWYEGGILGLLGIVLLLFGLVRAMYATFDVHDEGVSWAVGSGVAASIVFLGTAPMSFQQYGWMPAALVVAWWAQKQPRVAQRAGRGRRPEAIASALPHPT